MKISILQLMGLIFLSFSLTAITGEKKEEFIFFVKGKYGDHWYKIKKHKKKKKWICQTQSFPYLEVTENPLKKINWKKFENFKESKTPKCLKKVALLNSFGGKKIKIKGCFDNPLFHQLAKELKKNCQNPF